jgi:hypothetical protein
VRRVTLEGDRNRFDWERLALEWKRADIVLGPLMARERPITSTAP